MKLKKLFETGWITYKKPSNGKNINSLTYGSQKMKTFAKDQQDSAIKWWDQIISLFKKRRYK